MIELMTRILLNHVLEVNVKIETQHPFVEIEHHVHSHVQLRISFQPALIVLAIVEVRAPAYVPCLNEC